MKRLLKQAGVRQVDLARWLGVTERAIRYYVAGDRKPDPALILLLEYIADHPEARAWFEERVKDEAVRPSMTRRPSPAARAAG